MPKATSRRNLRPWKPGHVFPGIPVKAGLCIPVLVAQERAGSVSQAAGATAGWLTALDPLSHEMDLLACPADRCVRNDRDVSLRRTVLRTLIPCSEPLANGPSLVVVEAPRFLTGRAKTTAPCTHIFSSTLWPLVIRLPAVRQRVTESSHSGSCAANSGSDSSPPGTAVRTRRRGGYPLTKLSSGHPAPHL